MREFVARSAEALGGIDFLVNNAGGAHPGTFETLSDDNWVADLDVKLFSLIRCSREVLPHMRAAGGGRIVNIGAVYSRYPDPTFFATSVNRAAGNSFTKTLALEVAKDNILVNGVNIGFVITPQWENIHRRARRPPARGVLRPLRAAGGPARPLRHAGRGLGARRVLAQRARELHHRRVDRHRRRHGQIRLAPTGDRADRRAGTQASPVMRYARGPSRTSPAATDACREGRGAPRA